MRAHWRKGGVGATLLATWIAIAACADGTDDDHGGGRGDGGSGGAPAEFWCQCVDGAAITVDAIPDPSCEGWCQEHGGLAGYVPKLTAADTPECDAFCARLEALGCADCDRDFHCMVAVDSCVAAARAHLTCVAETGTFECNEDGSGWSSSSSCATYDELCTPDGGLPDSGLPDSGEPDSGEPDGG